MVAYVVEELADVRLEAGALADMDLMSPYVWEEKGHYRIMVRGVPLPYGADNPTGIAFWGECSDGLTFVMDPTPALMPGPDPFDAGGCEDPTVIPVKGGYLVYYTGVDAAHKQGALLLAEGPTLATLKKRAVTLKAPEGEGNIKEATLVRCPDGSWRLFYEYAKDDASRIGAATGPTITGPWTVIDDPFTIRQDSWDNWHLSTGPIVEIAGQDPVMFYNGATHDARWRIGWVSFSPDYAKITGRGIEPLLVPPPAIDRAATDIAFAASTIVEGDMISLYYSLEDRMLKRARVRAYV